jgi:hypothetical protein
VWNRVAVILFVLTTSALLLVGLVKDHVRPPARPLRGTEPSPRCAQVPWLAKRIRTK